MGNIHNNNENKWPRVYLAASIEKGCPRTIEWRKEAIQQLYKYKIQGVDPTRTLNYNEWVKNGRTYQDGGFVPRDIKDLRRCQAMLLYFCKDTNINRQSIGTWCEMGIAYERHIPIIICSDVEEVISHEFIKQLSTKIFPSLEEACEYLGYFFN